MRRSSLIKSVLTATAVVSIMNLVTPLALFFMLGLKFSSKRGRGIRIGKYSIYLL